MISITAFVDATVVPMDREHVDPHQTVVIQAGRIATMGPTRTGPRPG